MITTFFDLKVWQKAHNLVLNIYNITKMYPNHEQYCIVSQMKHSSASIATNIVEGYKRKTTKDFIHFLNIAATSLEETKYHILLSKDLSYITIEKYKEIIYLCDEIGKMLFRLQEKLSSRIH